MMKIAKYKVITVFSVIVFIFSLFITNLFAAQEGFKGGKELETMEKTEPLPSEVIVSPNVEYKAEDLRDPFQNPNIAEGKEPAEESEVSETKEIIPLSLTVQGLIWGGSFPQAIINNKVVKVGDIIEGARIISIDKEGITVFFEERQYNLSPPAKGATSSGKPQGG